MSVPRVIIAGTHSGVGKTSMSLAVMAGLKKHGYRVQAYKVGPDYIDPSYHEIATGRPSHNLDDWMMGQEAVEWLFRETSKDCDVAVIEGVMGLFDGFDPTGDEGSTAHIAKILKAPVILVVDASSMARSVAAIIKGYQELDKDIKIAGVILNRVASANHLQILRESIEYYNRCPVLGAVFRDETIAIPQRHLGLKPASENEEFKKSLAGLLKLTDIHPPEGSPAIDLKKIFDLARESQGQESLLLSGKPVFLKNIPATGRGVRIAYAKDQAFHFYYQANLDFLKLCGAQLIPFSPLNDREIPSETHALYFGGGFPEVYADVLEKNISMKTSVQDAMAMGLPIYAECGGLMYLTEGIKTLDGKVYQMIGAIPGLVEMTEKLVNFGYCENELLKDSFLGNKGERFRGHEFHYSRWAEEGTDAIHRVDKKRRKTSRPEGYFKENLLASYVHCHFLSYPQRAFALIEAAKSFSNRTSQEHEPLRVKI